jgi:hypothetical protein
VDDGDDETANGAGDKIRCMELPDGVYPVSSTSDSTASVCVECRRGTRVVEFSCDTMTQNRTTADAARYPLLVAAASTNAGTAVDKEASNNKIAFSRSGIKYFCAGRDPGVYGDITQGCKSFVVCRRFQPPVRGYCPGDGEVFDDAGRGCVKRGTCHNVQVTKP